MKTSRFEMGCPLFSDKPIQYELSYVLCLICVYNSWCFLDLFVNCLNSSSSSLVVIDFVLDVFKGCLSMPMDACVDLYQLLLMLLLLLWLWLLLFLLSCFSMFIGIITLFALDMENGSPTT